MPEALDSYVYPLVHGLADSGAWLMLVEVTWPDATVTRVVSNTENVTWPSGGGDVYTAMAFDFGDVAQAVDGTLPQVAVRVSNVGRVVGAKVMANNGGSGGVLRFRVVHSANLAVTDAVVDMSFRIQNAVIENDFVTLNLTAKNPVVSRFPRLRMSRTHCRYRDFKGTLCGYAGGETECNRTLKQCREYGNSARFGGFPLMGVGAR